MEQGWQKYEMGKGQKDVSFGPNFIFIPNKNENENRYARVKIISDIEIKDQTWIAGYNKKIVGDFIRMEFAKPAPSKKDYFYYRIWDIEGHTGLVAING